MNEPPPLWLCLLWIAWLVQAVVSALQCLRFIRQGRQTPRDSFQRHCPPATIIVPFKGSDPQLRETLDVLCTQQYKKNYRLALVVESQDDPAHAELVEAAKRHPDRPIDIFFSGKAPADVGQKVHNQIFVLDQILATLEDEHVLVFADSDAVPDDQWLRQLIGPLANADKTAVTTGYRWLIPSPDANCWSHIASVCNSSVACQQTRYRYHRAWGGSMALRVGTARAGDLLGLLRGAITDDYQFTRMARRLKKRVAFVPRCLVATPVDFDRRSFFNFGYRQYLITRVYAPGLFVAALSFMLLYMAGWLSAWAYLLYVPSNWVWPVGVLAVGLLCDQLRSTLRAGVIKLLLGEPVLNALRPTLRYDRWLTPLWMFVHGLIVFRACVGRTMSWRGVRYRLDGPQQVRELERVPTR